MINFRILKKKGQARAAKLYTRHGVITTPFFMPIATRGAVKNLSAEDLKSLGAEIILSNIYHLWQRPGLKIIKKAGGLHQFINWFGPILTDSGGFQVFSLSQRRTIAQKGVKFISEIDGKEYFLTAKKALEIQKILGSDIIMVLDVCPAYNASRKEIEKAVQITTKWAKESKKYFESDPNYPNKRVMLFGIAQGGIYKDLREKSAKELIALNFDGYAIGGLAVGEPRKKMYQVLDWVMPFLPEDKPRYLMGVGKPEEIVAAVKRGVDMFDCVIPTREARHGKLYKFKAASFNVISKQRFYEIMRITNSKFKNDLKPIDKNCSCFTCKNYSRAYLRHLFSIGENFGLRLATIHNLKFYLDLMKRIRQII